MAENQTNGPGRETKKAKAGPGAWTRLKKRGEAAKASKKPRRLAARLKAWLAWPLGSGQAQRWLAIALLSAVVAVLLFPSILEKTVSYKIGDVVERDIKASRTYLIEDTASTEKRRRRAAAMVPPVYDLDDKLMETLRQRVADAFEAGRRERTAEEEENVKAEVEAALGLEFKKKDWDLLTKIGFGWEVEDGLLNLISSIMIRNVVPSRELLLDDQETGITVRRLSSGQEYTVKDFFHFLDLNSASQFIKTEALNLQIGPPQMRRLSQALMADIATKLIKSNLTPNRHETEKRRHEVAEAVKPVFTQVRRGEMIIREGARVNPQILLRLNRETEVRRDELAWMRLGGMFLLLVVLLRCLFGSGVWKGQGGRMNGKDLLFVCATGLFVFLLARVSVPILTELARTWPLLEANTLVPALPVAAAAMLVGLILGLEAAFLVGLITSFLVAQLTEMELEFMALFLASSLVGAAMVLSTRNRGTIVRAGLAAGLVNMAMVLAIRLIQTEVISLSTPIEIVAGLLGGLLSAVIVTGLTPLVESLFGYPTDIKLLELANLDQPVLKELLFQAPGSYHHSIVVGNMVEVAAESIGANPLLAKVAAYYHDVGKVKKPLYFIENQGNGENRHEKLAPSMSALILIAHVKDGVEIAQRAKLGRQIQDIIAQHHGTSLITFFYDKATKTKGDKEQVNIEDFRYPGPKPQTKEAGLVMLADQVEAAAKSLTEPTPARIQGLVQRIVNRAFSDGQLSDCELTLKDLHAIAKNFNKVLSGIFHQRVQYPELQVKGGAKRKANGDSTPQRTESRPSQPEADQAEDSDNLRRLGIS